MTESSVSLEWYVSQFRSKVKEKLINGFIGNVTFEVNINRGDVANMNVTQKESVKYQSA